MTPTFNTGEVWVRRQLLSKEGPPEIQPYLGMDEKFPNQVVIIDDLLLWLECAFVLSVMALLLHSISVSLWAPHAHAKVQESAFSSAEEYDPLNRVIPARLSSSIP